MRIGCTLALLLALTPAVAAAQSGTAPAATDAVPKTLRQALEQAMTRREIAAAQLDIEAARAREDQAVAPFYPTLGLTMNATSTHAYDTFSGTVATATLPSGTVTVNVERDVPRYEVTPAIDLRYRLYSGGRDRAALAQSRAQREVVEADLSIARREVVAQVATAYFQLWKAQLRHHQARRWMPFAERKLALAKQRFGEGTLSEIDLHSEEFALAERRVSIEELALDLAARESDFLLALGRPPAEAKAAGGARFAGAPGDDAAVALQAIEPHLERQRAALEAEAKRQQIAVAKADYYPQVSLFAQYTGVGRSDDSIARSFGELGRRDVVVGMKLSMNLFDGHLTSARMRESIAEYASTKVRNEKAALAARHSADKARQAVRKAQADAEFAERKAELTRARQLVAKARHEAGRNSPLAVSQAELEVQDADDEVLIKQIDLALARVDEARALSANDSVVQE